jgi:predicted DNA-binding protein (MmcQ/YjbR family)
METEQFQHPVLCRLRDQAAAYPGVVEGDSCVKRAFRARDKGFLYLGEKADRYNVMVKLGDSFPDAAARAETEPDRFEAGKFGWVTVRFMNDERPPEGLLEAWIDESYRLQATRAMLADLDG